MKILLINSGKGPDYLADLIFGEFVNSSRYEIYVNNYPTYMFDDFPSPNELYGRGYTVFAKIQSRKKENIKTLSQPEIHTKILGRYFDKIIYTSIWRCSELISQAINAYGRAGVIAIDGEDHTNILKIAGDVEYYKRELLTVFENICSPISFSYPSFNTNKNERPSTKSTLLAPCVPSMLASYLFNTEESYYQQYSSAYFAITTKKGGWDCMRHYEIINAGCIPYFPDIVEKPPLTMKNYPVELQYRANKIFENCLSNPKFIENEKKEELHDLSKNFTSWLSDVGNSSIYQNLIKLK